MNSNNNTVRCDNEAYEILQKAQEDAEVGTPSLASVVKHAVMQTYGGDTTENDDN